MASTHDEDPRKLSETQSAHLRSILRQELLVPPPKIAGEKAEADDDASDLLDYALAMIANGKAVTYIVEELESMEMEICTKDTAQKIGERIELFLKDMQHGDGDGASGVDAVASASADGEVTTGGKIEEATSSSVGKMISLKSTKANALTKSGALGSSRQAPKSQNALTMSGALGTSRESKKGQQQQQQQRNNNKQKDGIDKGRHQRDQRQKNQRQGENKQENIGGERRRAGSRGSDAQNGNRGNNIRTQRSVASEAFQHLVQQNRKGGGPEERTGRGGRGGDSGRGVRGGRGDGRGSGGRGVRDRRSNDGKFGSPRGSQGPRGQGNIRERDRQQLSGKKRQNGRDNNNKQPNVNDGDRGFHSRDSNEIHNGGRNEHGGGRGGPTAGMNGRGRGFGRGSGARGRGPPSDGSNKRVRLGSDHSRKSKNEENHKGNEDQGQESRNEIQGYGEHFDGGHYYEETDESYWYGGGGGYFDPFYGYTDYSWHSGRGGRGFGGRNSGGRGRGRGRDSGGRGNVTDTGDSDNKVETGDAKVSDESTLAAAEVSPSPLIASSFGGQLAGRGYGFRGRGFRGRGRGRGGAGRYDTGFFASKSWSRSKDTKENPSSET